MIEFNSFLDNGCGKVTKDLLYTRYIRDKKNKVNICFTMSRNESDYQNKQRPGLRTAQEEVFRNLEIALPFFGFASSFVYTTIQQQLDNAAKGERAIEEEKEKEEKEKHRHPSIANNKHQEVKAGSIDRGRANEDDAIEKLKQELRIVTEGGDSAEEIRACATLGTAYRKRGDFHTAVEYHTQGA